MDSVHRITKGDLWEHKISGRRYEAVGKVLVKINGEWVDCVQYTHNGEMYARTVLDFLDMFVRVE